VCVCGKGIRRGGGRGGGVREGKVREHRQEVYHSKARGPGAWIRFPNEKEKHPEIIYTETDCHYFLQARVSFL
jgi:hypothetical protein